MTAPDQAALKAACRWHCCGHRPDGCLAERDNPSDWLPDTCPGSAPDDLTADQRGLVAWVAKGVRDEVVEELDDNAQRWRAAAEDAPRAAFYALGCTHGYEHSSRIARGTE
jgi:hypothetical protein